MSVKINGESFGQLISSIKNDIPRLERQAEKTDWIQEDVVESMQSSDVRMFQIGYKPRVFISDVKYLYDFDTFFG